MKNCTQCHEPFEVFDRDHEFYKKISPEIGGKIFQIPEPSLCPLCRQQRRFSFRNERSLYRRKCDGSGKEIISLYPAGSPYKVYAQDVWWQSNWDGIDYGRDYDFSRGFFEQFHDLMKSVPRTAILNMNSENSDYCNFTGDVKNSYLIFGSVYSQDCYYGSPYYSKNCVDTLVLRDCELCYECVDCRKLYSCLYCQDCNNSNDLLYCFDLQSCSDCVGCVGLRNKKYCIFNEQLTEQEYKHRRREIDLCNPEHHQKIQQEFARLKATVPHRAMLATQSENVSGSHVFNSKNTFESFFADRCEDSSYCAQVVDLKDCYDNNYTEENERCYEYLGMYGTKNTAFSIFCRNTNEVLYSEYLMNCQNVFGCSGLRNKQYCILNKQYTKEEYENLVPRIIEHMEKTSQWGEFFPTNISPFSYNETVAQEYFPLTKEQAIEKKWQWRENDQREFQKQTIVIPQNITEVPDKICYEILACEVTGRNYRIIPQELEFYRMMHLPIPRKHPDQRHRERIEQRNPRKLWNRKCDQCNAPITTSYPPDSPGKIYCEACYLKELY
ncbi:MAG: hypothetical protein AAB551_03545 [Patescibacteria group bacterium]